MILIAGLVLRNRCLTPANFASLAFMRCLYQDNIQSVRENWEAIKIQVSSS
jgi:hypothetical protein